MTYRISKKMETIKPSAIREIFKSLTDPEVITFASGSPPASSFPAEDIAMLSAEVLAKNPAVALQYNITEGYTPLREKLAARFKQKFDIGRNFDMTIVLTGAQQGIDLSSKVLCDEGDVVICQKPTYVGALNAFRANGAKIIGIDNDEIGMDLEQLEAALQANPNAKLIYVIPTFNNPMGTTMSLENRKGVYALAKKYGVMILEDDPYGELRFAGKDLPTIKSMDEDGIVLYFWTFSKILSPGMRVGAMVGPEELVSKIVTAKQSSDLHTNIHFQLVCDAYLEKFDIDVHIAKLRELYKEKSGLMLDEMRKGFPDSVKYTVPEGGIFLWCTLADGMSFDGFLAGAKEKKVATVPGFVFLPDESEPCQCFRLNYTMPPPEQIVKGIRGLSEVLRGL